MKKIFTLFFALVATTALWAEDFSVDGIYYNILTDKTNEVEVTSGSSSYSGSVTIPETVTYNGTTYSVTSIGEYAFGWCSGLTSVTIPKSVTSIGNYAFSGCDGLTSVTIPNSVTSIEENAFAWCSGLTSVTIPNSVTRIGDGAFASCSGLTSITLPNSVTSIGDYAFIYCSKLTSITIGNSVMSIGDYAFYNCSGLTSVTIPNSVTSIGGYAFTGCSSLPVENNLRYADTYLVEAVDKTLSTYSIKEGTKWIGDDAFDRCSGLTSITIPNSVTSIGEHAFYSCSGLTSVTCKAVDLPEMGTSVFKNAPTTAATLYVPGESLELYQAAEQWKEFGTILPISQVETDVENIGSDNGYGVMGNGKIIRNGQLIIIRDGVEYNTLGQAL